MSYFLFLLFLFIRKMSQFHIGKHFKIEYLFICFGPFWSVYLSYYDVYLINIMLCFYWLLIIIYQALGLTFLHGLKVVIISQAPPIVEFNALSGLEGVPWYPGITGTFYPWGFLTSILVTIFWCICFQFVCCFVRKTIHYS